ncbi:Cleavage and polyadenylation specificity factor subunit 6 [Sciurus carolinensis]|uniref:Cleavage and polyadenylation specificity factor subunit 6 n=1 Tax=Sciurus carolinensis TaxID=30640 RepID=A0AA41MFU0_SCICA|nr:Cleavage and polyadenylation specificity factor subunit 6 [Sciurus carolinensis]
MVETDEDLTEAVHSLGVNDILEIKFFENQANGQSKGFALVDVGSEVSSEKLMDLLPKRELHDQNPIATPHNKQFLSQFGMQSRKTTQSGQMSGQGKAGPPGGSSQGGRGQGHFSGAVPRGDRFPGPAGPGEPPPPFPAGQTPPCGPLGPPGPPVLPGHPPPSQVLPPFLAGPPNQGDGPPPPVVFPGQPFGQRPLGPLPPGPPPPVPGYGPPPGSPPPQQGPPPPPGPFPPHLPGPLGPPFMLAPPPHLPGPPPDAPPSGQHVNLAFFPPPTNSGMPTSDSQDPPPTDPYGRSPPYDRGDYGPPAREMDTSRTPLSEAEFEEIMNRNRAISSNTISRAVSDASAALCKIAFMELNPSHMVLDQDMNDQERGTIVDHKKRVGVTNPQVEIAMTIIIEREVGNKRDTGIITEIMNKNMTESQSIVIVGS